MSGKLARIVGVTTAQDMDLPWESESLQYRESGSYRFSVEQRQAYALLLDLKIISFVQQKYENNNSIPNNGFWGKATIFEGSVVRSSQQIIFPKQRVLSVVNRTIVNTALTALSYEGLRLFLEDFAVNEGNIVVPGESLKPVQLGPQETVVKFRGFPLSQFEFTCYWLPYSPDLIPYIDVRAEDPTDGDDEYYEPRKNEPDNPFRNNPAADPPNPDSDSRDFGDMPGGGYPTLTYFGLQYLLSDAQGAPNNCTGNVVYYENVVWELAGPPPYTIEFGFLPGSPCTGRGQGVRIRAADNSVSDNYASTATVFDAQINVFQTEPLT